MAGEVVKGAIHCCLQTAEMEFYSKGIFRLLEQSQKYIDGGGNFVEK
jgi:hypothetical protein